MCPHHLLLIQSSSEAAPQTAKKTVRQRGPLRCRTASLGPALRGPTSPKAKRKTCFICHDLGLRRCPVPAASSLFMQLPGAQRGERAGERVEGELVEEYEP